MPRPTTNMPVMAPPRKATCNAGLSPTLAACAVWVAIEVWLEPGGLWFWIALVATGYALWDFFLSGNYADTTD